jgi:hypothetical protein
MFKLFMILAVALTASAEQKFTILNSCSYDITNICGMPFPDSYQAVFDVRLCLRGSDKVSQKCQDYLTNVSPSVVEPCFEEIKRFCFNLTPGGNQISSCLSKYSSELSVICSVALTPKKQEDVEAVTPSSKMDEGNSQNLRLSIKTEAERRLTTPELLMKRSFFDYLTDKIDSLEESLQDLFAFFSFSKSEEETDDELDFKRYNSHKADDALHN